VPGSKGGWLFVKDSVKIARPDGAPFPAGIRDPKHGEEHVIASVEEGAVHELEPLPSAEEVAAGVIAADAAGAGEVNPGGDASTDDGSATGKEG